MKSGMKHGLSFGIVAVWFVILGVGSTDSGSPTYTPYDPQSTAAKIESSRGEIPVIVGQEDVSRYFKVGGLRIVSQEDSQDKQKRSISARIELKPRQTVWKIDLIKDGTVIYSCTKMLKYDNFLRGEIFLDIEELTMRRDIDVPDSVRLTRQ